MAVTAYVDYVVANHEGYVSLVKAAAGGNESLRAIYEDARSALNSRTFREDAQGEIIPDTPANRLVVRGWSAMVEELVLSWVDDPRGVSRDELLSILTASLPALVAVTPSGG
jgi:hypothetical protein